jgi:hypothetical protein
VATKFSDKYAASILRVRVKMRAVFFYETFVTLARMHGVTTQKVTG